MPRGHSRKPGERPRPPFCFRLDVGAAHELRARAETLKCDIGEMAGNMIIAGLAGLYIKPDSALARAVTAEAEASGIAVADALARLVRVGLAHLRAVDGFAQRAADGSPELTGADRKNQAFASAVGDVYTGSFADFPPVDADAIANGVLISAGAKQPIEQLAELLPEAWRIRDTVPYFDRQGGPEAILALEAIEKRLGWIERDGRAHPKLMKVISQIEVQGIVPRSWEFLMGELARRIGS